MTGWELMAVVSLMVSGACFAMVAHKLRFDNDFDTSGCFWAFGNLAIGVLLLWR